MVSQLHLFIDHGRREDCAEDAACDEQGFFHDDRNAVGALTSNISSQPAAVAAASGLVLATLLISSFNLIGSISLAYAMS